MAHGNVRRQKIYFLGQARLESLGTSSSNRMLYRLQMTDK
jgi:hypothetical protein